METKTNITIRNYGSSVADVEHVSSRLYALNKYAKQIRDETKRLKKEIFEEGGLKLSDDYFGSGAETTYEAEICWVDAYIREIEQQIEVAEENGNTYIESTADYAGMIVEDDTVTIAEAEEEIEHAIKYQEKLQEELDKAHDRIKYYSDENIEKTELYEIKDKILKKYGTFTRITHRFANDEYNVYDLYRLGDNEFHLQRELIDDEDIDAYDKIDDISSDLKEGISPFDPQKDREFLENILKKEGLLTNEQAITSQDFIYNSRN